MDFYIEKFGFVIIRKRNKEEDLSNFTPFNEHFISRIYEYSISYFLFL